MPLILSQPVFPFRGLRGIDAQGAGGFGAPRRSGEQTYRHKGLDVCGAPGDSVVSPLDGEVVHIGIAYEGSDLKTIHIVGAGGTEFEGMKVKLLYVQPLPTLAVGSSLCKGELIGAVQDRAALSPGMQNHVHVELYRQSELVDPTHWMKLPADPRVA